MLTPTYVQDALGRISVDDLPDPEPVHPARLRSATPMMERLWRIALADVEKNIVCSEGHRYLGAGSQFGVMVYTRDISYSGLLGLNRLCPELMWDSLRFTRDVRAKMGFKVSAGHEVPSIPARWEVVAGSEREYKERYHTNSYSRRTDDVVWLWCAADLLGKNGGDVSDWLWLYETGQGFFREMYDPFFDPEDGLYRGQASFVDVHFPERKTTGYPTEWSLADCILAKALSTNCMYARGLEAMAEAAKQLARSDEAAEWAARSDALKAAIRRQLRRSDGTFAYLKDNGGNLQERRDALGTALVVLTGVVDGEDAQRALAGYPITDSGVSLFLPFFPADTFYHNHSSWPFVDVFFIRASEQADGKDRGGQLAALLARTCVDDGTFHEVVDFRDQRPKGSGSQLWTAAAFIGLCNKVAGVARL